MLDILSLPVLALLNARLGGWHNLHRVIGHAVGNLLVAVTAVPVRLLKPVETARQRSKTNTDETEDGAGEAMMSC